MSCYKGIFWITNLEDYKENIIIFKTPCDTSGKTIFDSSIPYSSSDGLSFNHKNSWQTLPQKIKNKPYNYFPRGRVEIRNNIAYIFCNPNICNNDLTNILKEIFNLSSENGIKNIQLKPDYSIHYRCVFDT